MTRFHLLNHLQEIVGFKAGLALAKEEDRNLLLTLGKFTAEAGTYYGDMLADDDQLITIGDEALEVVAL